MDIYLIMMNIFTKIQILCLFFCQSNINLNKVICKIKFTSIAMMTVPEKDMIFKSLYKIYNIVQNKYRLHLHLL